MSQQRVRLVQDIEYTLGQVTSPKIRRILEPPLREARALLPPSRPWCPLQLLVRLQGPAKKK